jgi:hypothetical protein
MKKVIESGEYDEASKLQVTIQNEIDKLKELYTQYKNNNAV